LSVVVLALDTYHLAGAPSFTRPAFDPLVLSDPGQPRALQLLTGDERIRGHGAGTSRWLRQEG
jgi:hypothetical protein